MISKQQPKKDATELILYGKRSGFLKYVQSALMIFIDCRYFDLSFAGFFDAEESLRQEHELFLLLPKARLLERTHKLTTLALKKLLYNSIYRSRIKLPDWMALVC